MDRLNAEAVRLLSEKPDPRIDFLKKIYTLDSTKSTKKEG